MVYCVLDARGVYEIPTAFHSGSYEYQSIWRMNHRIFAIFFSLLSGHCRGNFATSGRVNNFQPITYYYFPHVSAHHSSVFGAISKCTSLHCAANNQFQPSNVPNCHHHQPPWTDSKCTWASPTLFSTSKIWIKAILMLMSCLHCLSQLDQFLLRSPAWLCHFHRPFRMFCHRYCQTTKFRKWANLLPPRKGLWMMNSPTFLLQKRCYQGSKF